MMQVSLNQYSVVDFYSAENNSILYFGVKQGENTIATFGKYDLVKEECIDDESTLLVKPSTFKMRNKSWTYLPQNRSLKVTLNINNEIYCYMWGGTPKINTNNLFNRTISLEKGSLYGLCSSNSSLVISTGETVIKMDRERRQILKDLSIENSRSVISVADDKIAVQNGSKIQIIEI
jgi:hypothetical protein